LLYQIQDTSALVIPEIDWEKNLKPEGDSNYIEILKTMTEAGVPIPIRAMAAAGGIKIDKVLKQKEDDLEVRKRIADYQKKISELAPKKPGGDSDDYEAYSSVITAAFNQLSPERQQEILKTLPSRSSIHNASGRPPFLRGSQPDEVVGSSKTGKRKYIHNQKKANEDANRDIVKAMFNMGKRGDLL
jgi:hypothetical protein